MSQDKWNQFFRLYDGIIVAVVRWPKWRFSEADRAEIAQRIRVEVVKRVDPDAPAKLVNTILRRIAVCRCIDEVRRQVRRREVFMELLEHEDGGIPIEEYGGDLLADPVKAIEAQEMTSAIDQILREQGETCRQIIRNYYCEDRSYAEISAIYQISINTVGTRLSRCLAKLRQKIQQNGRFREYFGDSFELSR